MKYTLALTTSAAYDRWKKGGPLDEGMIALRAAVAACLDANVFYNREMDAKIIPLFELTEEEMARGKGPGGVEGGVFGYEIYLCRKMIEAERAAKAEAEARERVKAIVGEELPTMVLRLPGKGERILKKAKVKAIGDGGIVFSVSLGGRKFEVTAPALLIENGRRVYTRNEPFLDPRKTIPTRKEAA